MTYSNDGVAVTYTGREDPFVDRLYGSGLTFTKGQTRTLPAALASRLLTHHDVFVRKQAEHSEQQAAPTPEAQDEAPKDDTEALLDEAKQREDEAREQEESRFLLTEQIKAMDKEGLRAWAKDHLKENLPGNANLATLQKRVLDHIEQYGAP